MNKKFRLLLFFQIIFILVSFGQEDKNSNEYLETTPDSILFQRHLDSLYKYNYENHQKLREHIAECNALLAKNSQISSNDRFNFAIALIDFELSQFHYTKAYQLLKEYKYFLDDDKVSINTKNEYYYTEGYTLMVLGDLEFAQKSYYKLLEYGEKEQDTLSSMKALFSLGQLFAGEKDYKNGEKYFLKAAEVEKTFSKNESDHIQIYYELAILYLEMEDFEQSTFYNQLGIKAANEYQTSMKVHFILTQGEVDLKQGKILSAQKAFDSAYQIAMEMQNEGQIQYCLEFQATLLDAQGKHKKALKIYENFLAKDDKESLFATLEWNNEAHKISSKLGDYKKAYEYQLVASSIKDSMANEKKMQQTEFLNIKFNSEKKEKENEILAAQIAQKDSQNKFLYVIAAFFLFGLVVVIGAFFQKRKYNKRLKKDVEDRTKDLEHANNLLTSTNEELDQFNKILSHDLKEPLRSIVGFSTLAKKKVDEESSIGEYLNIIGRSGKQLHQLIEDVSVFQRIGSDSTKEAEKVNIHVMMNTILESVSILLMEKKARIKFQNLPTIRTHRLFLFLVFKNLIENGLKYNTSVPPLIEISYHEKNNNHFFQFKDNGIGIAPQFQERVFGMFKRLNDRSAYSGSGMGLSISRKMMKKLDGTISIIHSEEGKGSTFQVSLPIIKTQIDNDKLEMKMSVADSN